MANPPQAMRKIPDRISKGRPSPTSASRKPRSSRIRTESSRDGGPHVNDSKSGQHDREQSIARFHPPPREVRSNIEDHLQDQPHTPEHRDVCTDPPGKWRSAGELRGIQNAHRGEGDNRQHDVAAVHPMHLTVKAWERPQLVTPVQTKWNLNRCDQKAELSDTCEENQSGGGHGSAP